METKPNAVRQRRLVTIDGDGQLHTSEGTSLDVVADQLYAIIVLWNQDEGTSWLGWLTTTAKRSACFSAADLEDPIVQNWLRALPGWDHEKLWQATTCPGSHLVWRRPTTMAIP